MGVLLYIYYVTSTGKLSMIRYRLYLFSYRIKEIYFTFMFVLGNDHSTFRGGGGILLLYFAVGKFHR